ncbi:MAG TPA: hypothetical protein VHR66_15575 [Gemmataceae bacterium]|nr:hypothetical protein [Gemmataceae bacterium]
MPFKVLPKGTKPAESVPMWLPAMRLKLVLIKMPSPAKRLMASPRIVLPGIVEVPPEPDPSHSPLAPAPAPLPLSSITGLQFEGS